LEPRYLSSWREYRDQYGHGTSGEGASEILDDLILDNLIQLDDMGNEIGETDCGN